MADAPPPLLRDAVARTLAPVHPLRSPARRVVALLPVAALSVAAVLFLWGLRKDVALVGPFRLWAGSAVQIAAAFVVLAAALAESIPGRLSPPRSLVVRAAGALCVLCVLTVLTFLSSPTYVPPLAEARYIRVCFGGSFELGLLVLAAAGFLMCQGLTARPVVAGALAGLGAGLIGDSAWRLFCYVSDPAHVFLVHLAAVLAVAAVGALVGAAVRWLPRGAR